MNWPNDLDTATAKREGKALATLAAQFALIGVELIKSDPEISGQAPYHAVRHDLWEPLHDLEAAREYLLLVSCSKRDVQELQAQ
ncbi:MAG: hypothetical protein V4731_03180 [Pseudomonadota bacterium]